MPICDPETVEMLPIFMKMEGRPCLVVGAGTIASPKIQSLLRAGGSVTVVAPKAASQIQEQAAAIKLTWVQREFIESDLDGIFLVIAATDIQVVNHRIAVAARTRGILCNSVDDPPDCDFYYPSVVRRGDLQIAISTAGKSPALAQRLRQEIDALLPEDTGDWLDRLGELRQRMLAAFPITEDRKHALHLLARRELCEANSCPVQQTLNKMLANTESYSARLKEDAQEDNAPQDAPESTPL